MKFRIKKSKDPVQPWYFTIENQGNILCSSETYHNLQDVKETIESIKQNAPGADVITEK